MNRQQRARRCTLVAAILASVCAHGQEPQTLKLTTHIDLAGVEGRIDHFSVDAKGNRLFVSALGNHTVEVLDIASGKRLRTIAGLAEPQGVYYDPSSNRLFVACAKDGTTKIFDGTTYAPITTVSFPANADNVRDDSRKNHFIVGYGSGALAFLDATSKKIGEIALAGHPESFQLEKTGTRVFVNVPNSQKIQIADLASNRVIGEWPVTSARRNFPMALDEPDHRMFTGCRTPARMLVIDTERGATVASVEIVGDTDDLFYDAGKRRIYVIGGEGFVDVFSQKDGDHYDRIGHYPTAPGARTGLFVPSLGRLFVAVPHRGEQRAEVLVYETN